VIGEGGTAVDFGDHMTLVMGECPKLHSREINQEAIVSLILTALFTCEAFALTPASRFGNHASLNCMTNRWDESTLRSVADIEDSVSGFGRRI
jgi:hypothetical protein